MYQTEQNECLLIKENIERLCLGRNNKIQIHLASSTNNTKIIILVQPFLHNSNDEIAYEFDIKEFKSTSKVCAQFMKILV